MRRQAYFAYGSNLSFEGMARRAPEAVNPRVAVLDDWRLTFSGVADIEEAKDDRVYGGLWWLSESDFWSIDAYEGAPHLYRRERVTVQTASGPVRAITYVMNRSESALPSAGYSGTIADGYRNFGLPLGELWTAIQRVDREVRELEPTGYKKDGKKRVRPTFGDSADDIREVVFDDWTNDDVVEEENGFFIDTRTGTVHYREFEDDPSEDEIDRWEREWREQGWNVGSMSPATIAHLKLD